MWAISKGKNRDERNSEEVFIIGTDVSIHVSLCKLKWILKFVRKQDNVNILNKAAEKHQEKKA